MIQKRKRNHENCLFCDWLENWEEFSRKNDYRLIEDKREKGYFVILSRNPKMAGHTLVISVDPYDDITDDATDDFKPHFPKKHVLEAVVEFSKRIKKKLHAKKVYVTTMCEHYEPEEIKEKKTTEHLHFHLYPRYEGAPKGEKLFCLPDKKAGVDWEATPIAMEMIKNKLKDDCLIHNA
jgi:diadenosine tetraphosphate (Ap4A) HIT family hydrolase